MIKYFFLITLFFNIVNSTTLEYAKEIEQEEGIKKAIPIYKKLSNEYNPEAMYKMAKLYLQGKHFKQSITKAHDLLLIASDLNHTKSQYALAKIYFNKNTAYYNKTKAYNLLVDSANLDYPKSQTMLGKFFLFGIVVEKDYKKAKYYFEKASKNKDYNANCYIALMYADGLGVYPNLGRAHAFAKDEYKRGNKFCKKVWKDFSLEKYPKDGGWKLGYRKPVE